MNIIKQGNTIFKNVSRKQDVDHDFFTYYFCFNFVIAKNQYYNLIEILKVENDISK